MRIIVGLTKSLMSAAVVWAILICGVPVSAQGELVPVSDVTGGSSVFVFRASSSAAPRRFVSKVRATRSKSQRIETAKKVRTQYAVLAKAAPRRTRTASVDPQNLPPAVKTMAKDEASRLFAGVGEYYMDRDEFDQAIKFFRESVTLDPANTRAPAGLSEALALRGNDLLVKDNAAIARKFFEEALKYNPRNSPAYFGLAEVFADLDQPSEAVASYEKALASDKDLTEIYVPLGILYYQQGEIAKAESMLSKALAISPNDAQTQYFLGLIRYSQNRDQDALTAFQKAKSLDPNNAEIYFHSGEAQARSGNNALAIEDFGKATSLKSDYFDAWLGLGSAYFEMSKYPEAVTAYKQAVRLRNNNIDAYVNLADAYRLSGNYNDAEANYNLAATFISRSTDFNNNEAADVYAKMAFVIAKQCAINMKQGMGCKWPVAVRALEKATALSQSNIDQANLGWAYYNVARMDMTAKRDADAKANLERAKVTLQKAVASNPAFVEAPLLNLGITLNDLGDYAGAAEALTRVIDKQPKWVFAINELGIAYRKQNNFKEAANQFRKAISKDDKYVVAYYNLAEAEFRAGNLGEAKKAYGKLKKLGANGLAAQLELMSGGTIRG